MKEHKLSNISIEDILKQIEKLKKIDLTTIDPEDLKTKINKLMDGYSTRTISLNVKTIFRTRPNRSNRVFHNAKLLWYPPVEEVKEINRLNDIGEVVFYSSKSEGTAVLEHTPKIGEILTVLRCDLINSQKRFDVMSLGLKDASSEANELLNIKSLEEDEDLKKYLYNDDNFEKNKLINSFLNRQFTEIVNPEEKYKYKITSTIGKIFLSSPRIDGLIYPSISSRLKDLNLVLKPKSVDKLYKPTICWMIEIEKEIKPLQFIVKCIKKTKPISPDWKLNWD